MRAFGQLQAASIDGRLHNVFHRQTELEKLCKALIDQAAEIQDAISQDYGHRQAEAKVEFALAIAALKRNYATLQPDRAHQEEYLVASGKDAPSKRAPYGIVYIEPCNHSLFYSIVVPLSAALAAGNCVILLLENNLRAISSVLRRILQVSLDGEVFALAASPVTDQDFLDQCLVVNQRGGSVRPKSNELVSMPSRETVAIVDRTADIALAAREINTARRAFGGMSPYAPDVVLVNEFVKPKFLEAVNAEFRRFHDEPRPAGKPASSTALGKVKVHLERLQKIDDNAQVVLQDDRPPLVDLSPRSQALPDGKVDAPVLVTYGTKSLDDAIDTLGRHQREPYLAAYIFANPASAKYLSQFINASVSFVNHIPGALLVGPTHPVGCSIDPMDRYPIELFSEARPTFVKPKGNELSTAANLGSCINVHAEALLREGLRPMVVKKRHPGGAVGFFEQGFLMSASFLLLGTAAVTVSGFWYAWKWTRSRR